ncbi:MAG TPA: hypothetical protein VH164_00840 [Ktedonobacteraceae bacterium]|nr:hypothetical protein [Ktedonobacteraceae bacterium]
MGVAWGCQRVGVAWVIDIVLVSAKLPRVLVAGIGYEVAVMG